MARPLLTRIAPVLTAFVLLAASGCTTGYTTGEEPVITVSALEATATAAVVGATSAAESQQQTVEAARTTLEADRLSATQQAEATIQAAGTLSAVALELTTQAQATADTQEDLSQQLTVQAHTTATEQAVRAAATEQALIREAIATEGAFAAAATTQALTFHATMTAISNEAAQYAIEAAAEQRRQLMTISGIVLATVLVATAILGVLTITRRYLAGEGAANGQLPSTPTSTILQEGPCPPMIVQPDGTVEIPLLHDPSQPECVMSPGQIDSVLQWAGRQRAAVQQPVAVPAAPLAPGLRTIRSVRRLDQAVRTGAISRDMAQVLEADWRRVSDEG